MADMEFDYVVVGGGAGGCAVAGRLSEDPSVSVAVLEAGGSGDSWVINTPAAAIAMLPTKLNNWAFETVPQPGLNGRRGYQPRGKALGGSSAINAMCYIRGHRSDYDRWAALGNPGWSYDEVLPYFKRSENNATLHDAYHGQGGPIHVGPVQSDNPFQHIFLNAAREAGFAINPDFNGAEQEGVGTYQVTQFNGERWSAARGYLHPHLGKRPNLQAVTGAQATRIVLEGKRAVGVEFIQGGQLRTLRARREVLLAAGALQTPQLLMLSGIGDGAALQQLGIAPAHHLPGVGRNLQDHPDFIFNYEAKNLDLFGFSLAGGVRIARELARYRKTRRGMISTNYAEGGAFLKTDPGLAAPDVQLHFVIAKVDDHARSLHWGHGYSCHVCVLRPKSIGELTLASRDPLAAPLINPRFLEHPDDIDTFVKGYKLTRKLMNAPALASLRSGEPVTAGIDSDDQIRAILRQRADTVYHPVGTCKMGVDEMAVVDPALKVHGMQGLRVVDASIMPTLIGGNTNAPTMMIGEKAADMIKAG